FFLADDLGVMDLTNEGSSFHETPNIDRIANEGVRFTRGYATCQVCSPSRASIMSGKYPARLNITDWINPSGGGQPEKWKRNTSHLPAPYLLQLPLTEVTIAEALKEGGYSTFFAGKWHLGGEGFYPEDQGFDINKGGHEKGSPPGGFFSPYNNPKLEDGPVGESLPIRLGEETAGFIEASKEKPFFAMLSFYSVHGPDQTTVELYQKYRQKALALPEVKERFLNDVRIPVRQVQDNPIYGGMMESMDDAVGIVLDKLDSLSLSDNTIVIFTSDNGGVSAGDAFSTSNLPLRGGKGIEYEGGVREPCYIRWPAKVKPGISDTPVTGTDFYPTILEACGLPLRPEQHVDGVSLMPVLKGGKIDDRRLYWHYPHYSNQGGEPVSIMLDGDWKLIEDLEDGSFRLYNVSADIGEQNDLAEKFPDRVDVMAEQLHAWKYIVSAETMSVNENFDAEKFAEQQKRSHTVKKEQLEKFHHKLVHPPKPVQPGEPVTYKSSAFK
ncbi:MAG: sulfatase, partial [Verrucomicrobiales bacterium]|nr:sulfatase [Verrucomicrobiales bacterium]